MGYAGWSSRRRRLAVGALVVIAAAIAGPWCVRQGQYWHHLRQARLALDKGVADNAVLALRSAIKLRPEAAEAHFLLGVSNRRAGHLDQVRAPLDRAEQLGWSRRAVNRQRVLLAFQAGDRAAEAELRESLERPMTDEVAEETCEALALGYLSEYRLIDAQTCLDYWIAWQPGCVRARLLRAELPWVSGDRQKQLDEYHEVLKLDPENYTAHQTLAHLYLAQHKIDEALKEYSWCRQVWPADPIAQLGVAACLQHQGKLEEAMQAYEKLYRSEAPPHQRAYLLSEIGQVYLNNSDYEQAVKVLSESVELYPYDPTAQYSLGSALSKLGRKEQAKVHLDRAKQIEGYREQLADVERQIATHPDDPEMRFQAATALKHLGHAKASAAMMLAVLRWDPNYRPAHAALAEYYREIGRDDLADEHGVAAEADASVGDSASLSTSRES